MSDPAADTHGTHSYYDWQISTLMLAYDVVEPLSREDVTAQQRRQQQVEMEVRDLALGVIPEDYQRDATREFPPELVMQMTRATLRRAAQIVALI